MKILRLRLNNLASISGEHSIDFESAPLANAGLIAITGKTGSGKSTLLDAMCLALYDQIPRLTGAAGSLMDSSGQGIQVKDSKNILRRGCTSGFAELEFEALDHKRYVARWEIRRARNKIDGNLKTDRSITCSEDQRVLTQKISECTPCVEKLIGLSFEQFTRAVLLPQSDVGAFLKAKDPERADLLEYLTNSSIFSLVSQKAYEKTRSIKAEKEQLQTIMGHIELLSEEQIQAIDGQYKQVKAQLEAQSQQEKLLNNDLNWHKQQHQLHAEITAKYEVYQVQLDAEQKMLPYQQLLAQLEAFQPIRAGFLQQQQLITQRQTLQPNFDLFKAQFAQLESQTTTKKQQLDQLSIQYKQQQQHFLQIQPHVNQALNLDNDIAALIKKYREAEQQQAQIQQQHIDVLTQRIAEQQQTLQHTEQAIASIHNQLKQQQALAVFDDEPQAALERLKQYQAQQHAIHQQHPDYLQHSNTQIQQQLQQQRESVKQLEDQFAPVDQLESQLNEQQKQLKQLTQQQHAAQNFSRSLKLLITTEIKQHDTKQQLHAQTATVNNMAQANQSAEQQFIDAKQQRETLQKLLEQQRLLQTKNVQELRAQLETDQACMVCGSTAHPFIEHHDILAQALATLHSTQEQDALTAEHNALSNWQKKQAANSHALALQHQLTQQLAELSTQLKAQQEPLQSELALTGFTVSLNQAFTHVETEFLQQQQQLEQQLHDSQQQNEAKIKALHSLRTLHQQIQQHAILLERLQQFDLHIEPVICKLDDGWHTLWHKDPIGTAQQLTHRLQERSQATTQLKQLDAQRQPQQHQLQKLQESMAFYQQQLDGAIQNKTAATEQGKILRQQIHQLSSQFATQQFDSGKAWLASIEQDKQQQIVRIETAQTEWQVLLEQLHQAKLQQQDFISQLKQIDDQIQLAIDNIQHWKANHPQFDAALIDHCLQHDNLRIQQIRQDIQRQQQAVLTAKSAYDTLNDQIEKHHKLQPERKFDEVIQQLELLQLEKNKLQDDFNQLDSLLRVQSNAQAQAQKYRQEIERIAAEEYRWNKISELIGSKEGSKFQRIAQEHNLDILVEYANQQLQPLAARYQLQRIPNSLGLAIIDHDMNGEIRPVLSLSGGETFLVSLALALAIANMASGSMKLESLFIDEGFGTLDPNSLHMVMDALDRLQSQGRKVILISHIAEMHERIPVKIQVIAQGSGASMIKVLG